MSRFDDFFFSYQKNAHSKCEKTLRALETEFGNANIEFPREQITEGPLPFREFSYWLARKLGVTKRSEDGEWPRYHGSCWTLINENVLSEKERYIVFFEWFEEFQQILTHRCGKATTPLTNKNVGKGLDRIERFEAWECSPSSGFLKFYYYVDGLEWPDGFYSTLDELIQSTKLEFGIEPEQWDCV